MNLEDLIASVSVNLGVDTGVEKQASEKTSEQTLEEMLTKSASEELQIGEISQMNKQAQAEKGIALANAILDTLVKQANSVVDETTAQVASDDAKIQIQNRENQTVTDVLQNNILKAIAEGAAQENAAVAVGAPSEAAVEGAAQVSAPAIEGGSQPAPSGPMMGVYGGPSISADEVEKAAAVSELVGQGRTFEDAVSLVKQAAEQIASEEMEMAKLAAATTLIKEAGVSLDEAVALVNMGVAKMVAG